MPRPVVFTFYSYKGGVGRTLLAANLAVGLARRGKTLIWDLDVEAPGLHRLRALRSEGSVETGFFDWLIAWQTGGYKDPGPDELAAFVSAIRSTPFSDLALLPAHGDDANPGTLYASIDWARWLADEPTIGRDLLTRLLGHLGEQGYRHVLLDARTGLTDLGGLLAGVIPDATILVGGYGAQNLGGLGLVVERLRREDDEAEKGFRAGRPKPRLFLIASPIPQNDAKLRAAGQELWRSTFGPSESAHEIPFDPALPFSEELLITKPGLRIAEAYEKPVRDLAAFAETVETDFEKGEEEVRARPDLFDGLHPRLSRANREKRFEELVAELLRLLGYTVELEQLIDSNKVDLLARIQVGVDENTYLVECKDHEKAGGKETVEKLHGWLGQPRARSLGARGMVVARGFSPAAITYAKEQGIKTLTAEDLERQLVDFGRYLDDLIRRFEQSPLAASYVTQRSRPGATPDKVIEDLAAYGARWANGIGNRLWVLLGDYGTGKTAFSEKLAYDLAKQARGDFSKPIPFLINLRDVPNKASLDEVLHEHWARATGQRKDPRLFLHLVGRGRLVLLLDSFDEMGIATAGRSVVEQLRNLVKLTGEAGETSQANRVLVTCREQFFREHGEALKAARGETDSISPLTNVALSFDGAIDTLERFTPKQIGEYLVKRLGKREGAKAQKVLKEKYLASLADRPQLLEMIIKSLPRLQQEETKGGGSITPGALYQAYTNEWLDDLRPRERQSSSEQLKRILEIVAVELWGRIGNRIHYGDLYTLFKDRSDLREGLDPNQLDVELRTAAFLSRTPDGHYGFSHRSFLEFFLARQLARAAKEGPAPFGDALALPRLSFEAMGFLLDLLSRDESLLESLLGSLLAAPSNPKTGTNLVLLTYSLSTRRAGQSRNPEGPIQGEMSRLVPPGASLVGIDLSEAVMPGIGLPGADLRRSIFARGSFSGARLEGATLEGADLEGADFSNADLRGANLTAVSARSLRAPRAILSGATLDRGDFHSADLSAARLAGAQATEASLAAARLPRSDLSQATFTRSDLRAVWLGRAEGLPCITACRTDGLTALGAAGLPESDVAVSVEKLAAFLRARHSLGVTSVAYSADGARIVTGGRDLTARVWDAATGQFVMTLGGHEGGVTSVAFSGDGARIVTGSWEGPTRVWDATTGHLTLTLGGREDWAMSVACSADGARIVTGSRDRTARVWEAASGQLVVTLSGHDGGVASVAYSTDCARIVTGSGDGTARVWNAATGQIVLTLGGHEGGATSVTYSPDGARIVTGSGDGTTRVWDVATGQIVLTLGGHEGGATSVAYSPDGARIVTGSGDGTARVWEAATGLLVLTIGGNEGGATSVAYSVDGAWIVTGSGAGPARIWDAATGHRVLTLGGQEPGVTSVACSADGARIVTGSWGRTARVWDAATDRPVLTLGGREGGVASVACSADGARIVTGGWVGTASVWDAATGQLVLTLGGREGGVTSVAFSADGARIVTGSWIGTARVWDAATGHLVLSLGGHGRGVWSVAYSAVGGRIVTASRDKSARVWDAATGQLVLTLGGEEDRVTSVACSADGARIFTGSWDGTARVWDAATGELIRTLGGHEGGISSAAYSADGARIVTGGWDGTARVWDAATGHLVQTLDGHEGGVSSAVFSAYGARVVTGGWDGAARVWDSKSGRLLSAMSGLFDGWFSLDYRADPRGLWRGEGRALDDLVYRDTSEEPGPAPWVPRYWHAVDLPELKAPD